MKKLLTLLLAVVLVFTFNVDTFAKGNKNQKVELTNPTIIEEQITVTSKGGNFKVGFVKINFKKEFLDETELPITFDVKIYAENGEVYVEFTPDVNEFFKDVKLHAEHFSGYIYDVATGENIYVEIPNQSFKVEHFSRYCWAI